MLNYCNGLELKSFKINYKKIWIIEKLSLSLFQQEIDRGVELHHTNAR
jgi:hypothetical protein